MYILHFYVVFPSVYLVVRMASSPNARQSEKSYLPSIHLALILTHVSALKRLPVYFTVVQIIFLFPLGS